MTLARFARWQLSSRLAFGASVVPFVDGSVLIVARGMTGATGNVYVGLHECHDMGFFLHLLRAGDLFLDLGANVGSYTVLGAKGTGCDCVSVEPIDATYQRLIDNVRVNRIEELVHTHCVALGGERGTLRLSSDLDTMNHVVDAHYRGASKLVDVVRLDDLVDRSPLAIKIDVEGFEHEVLRGAPRILADRQLRAVLIETNDLNERYSAGAPPTARALLESAGFARYRYDACARELSEWRNSREDSSGNSLYLRDPDFIRLRLRAAPTFRVGPWTI
jgi:FkbM family methyltransferase